MESVKQTCKRVFLGRCKRCREGGSRGRNNNIILKVRESLGKMTNNKNKLHHHHQVAPEGCLWVYVGPHRERFLLKIELANHPMFKMLLDEAESEYGYRNEGPIWLPCDVNLFCEALAEMEEEKEMRSYSKSSWGCSFHHPNKSYPNSLMHSPLSYLSNHTSHPTDYYQLLISPS